MRKILFLSYLRKRKKQTKSIGIAFLITNYLKGGFFALFCDRSGVTVYGCTNLLP